MVFNIMRDNMRLTLVAASAVLLAACSSNTKEENAMTAPDATKATEACPCDKAPHHAKKKTHKGKKAVAAKKEAATADHKEEAKKEEAPAADKKEAAPAAADKKEEAKK
jgi:hypothetical protein